MAESAPSYSRDGLRASLKQFFTGGALWPVDRAALAAMTDMGLSNGEIAGYFAVGPDEVHMLREHYGLGG